jgi:hypothetical protein
MNMETLAKKITWLTLFSVAMGFMESAVVIYLRKIYYPQGFSFPLAPISADIAGVEFLREAATVVMLTGIGILAGNTRSERFGWFMFCFAVWDLFYYVFLKAFLDWPESLLTWDILFLIPFPWVGPVLAPCLVSFVLAIWGILIGLAHRHNMKSSLKPADLFLFAIGCVVIIFSFTSDYFSQLRNNGSQPWTLHSDACLFSEMQDYIPCSYSWLLFVIGFSLLLWGITGYAVRNFKRALA